MTEPAFRLWLGRVLFAALVIDVGIYALAGRRSELVDGLAWLTLLGLFMWETHRQGEWPRHWLPLIHALRLVCVGAVLWAAVAYVREEEWLDALNAWLWLGVVALLEAEIRLADHAARHRRLFTFGAAFLYGALALFIPLWLYAGETLDALDGALWLAAFFLIELDLLGRSSARG